MKKKLNCNKKAEVSWLTGHTMNIIVAVLCLIVLVYVGYQVYMLFSDKTDLQKSEANMKSILNKIQTLKESNNKESIELLIYSPTGWVLRAYSSDYPSDKCYSKKSCLCLCQQGTCLSNVPKICNGFDYPVEISATYKVEKSKLNPMNYIGDDEIYTNSIGFVKAVEGLRFSSSGDGISIDKMEIKNEK